MGHDSTDGPRVARGGDYGTAAHESQRELGVGLSDKIGKVLVALEALDRSLRAGPSHPLLGLGSLFASLIESGPKSSSYSERCLLQLDRRAIPSEAREMLNTEMWASLTQVCNRRCRL
jgi:acetylornithine deacetylase